VDQGLFSDPDFISSTHQRENVQFVYLHIINEDHTITHILYFQIAHVIREIRLFQQTPYRIEHHPRVTINMSNLSSSIYLLH
jgi:DNA-directed RNA polymerase subunit L